MCVWGGGGGGGVGAENNKPGNTLVHCHSEYKLMLLCLNSRVGVVLYIV